MRLYLVRRTRSFIQDNYAETDPPTGRKYLTFEDGSRDRTSRNACRRTRCRFEIDDQDPERPVRAPLRARPVVDAINQTCTCRATASATTSRQPPHNPPTPTEAKHPRRSVPRRQAPDGLLPHQPVQAARKQRRRVSAIGRAAHPPQLRLFARHRERTSRCPSAPRTLSCWTRAINDEDDRRCRPR